MCKLCYCLQLSKHQWLLKCFIWAASWQNQQNGMCTQRRLRSAWASAQSDQSLLSAWRKLGSLATHWMHSDDAQADQSLRWAQRSFCWFCHEAAEIIMMFFNVYLKCQNKDMTTCIWAGPWENVSYVICERQRPRSACASAQSAPLLFATLYNISRFYIRNFKTLASFCGCAGWFESGLVGHSWRHVFSWRGSYK